jgi:outer membrane protein assembly factor BamB
MPIDMVAEVPLAGLSFNRKENQMTAITRTTSVAVHVTLGLALVAWTAATSALLAGDAALAKPDIEKCEVTRPKGEYAQVVLEFDQPGKWVVRTTLRDGKIAIDSQVGVRDPGGVLELSNGALTGSFLRYIEVRVGKNDYRGMQRVKVEGSVKGNVISGKYTYQPSLGEKSDDTGKEGLLSGSIMPEADLAKNNAVPAALSWGSMLGPAGSAAAAMPSSAKVVDSLDQARLVWRSEDRIPQGLAPITRFMQNWDGAASLRSSGGSFSPVLAEGKVFCSYRLPRPGAIGSKKGQPSDIIPTAQKLGLEPTPSFAMEKLWAECDEIVVAMDAATGKTVWRAVIGIGVGNVQNHKERESDRTPAYGDGRVYIIGRAGFVYAFEAATGKPLWQAPCAGRQPINGELHAAGTGAFSLTAGAGVVLAPSRSGCWAGLDGATGAEKYQVKGAIASWSATRWMDQGKLHFLVPVDRGVVCIEADTGKELWCENTKLSSRMGVVVQDDWMVAYVDVGSKDTPASAMVGWKLTAGAAQKKWEIPGLSVNYGVPVSVNGKRIFGCTNGLNNPNARLAVVELATGKVLDERSKVAQDELPGNGGYVQAIGNLVLVRLDGSHGGNHFITYAIGDDGKVGKIAHWDPAPEGSRASTTSYHHPIHYPLVDGRMFMRRYDGIYCYDLRKP